MRLKTIFLILCAGLIAIPAAMAAPASCQTGTFASSSYGASGFSCTINGLLFDTFGDVNTANPNGLTINGSNITITPITTTGQEGFMFSFGSSVKNDGSNSTFQDEDITFHVSTLNNSNSITSLTLFFNGSFTGTGTSSVTENYCVGHTLVGCPSGGSGQIKVTNPPPSYNDQILIAGGTNSLYVSKDINATSGTNGTANISNVSNTYPGGPNTSVPEPFTMMLVGSGLVGLGVMRRFRRN